MTTQTNISLCIVGDFLL